MNRRKIWIDPGFWILISINGYLVYDYYRHPGIFTTLIWLYWSQSVLMGVFNWLDILTVSTIKKETVMVDGKPQPSLFKTRALTAFFFLGHYGFFHLVYFLFLKGNFMKKSEPIQWDFFKYFFYAFLVGQVISFIQHKIYQRKHGSSLGAMFVAPYIRIIPMHLTILLPCFLPISNMTIFLVLKSAADVIMYIVTKPVYKSRETDAAMLATQQGVNMNI